MAEAPLHERIARRALAHVSHPPTGEDQVIEQQSPSQLVETFEATTGLDLGSGSAHTDDEVMAAVEQVLATSVQTSHPRFMNQNYAGPDPVGVVGDWLAAALSTTNATFEVAPVFTMMERAVLSRLAGMIGFESVPSTLDADEPAPGLFCAGGLLAGLMALQLARHRVDPDVIRRGTNAQPMALFVSEAGHYSATKNAAVMGLGTDAVFEVSADAAGSMRTDALVDAIDEARSRGRTPLAIIATAGTTVTAAFDPIDTMVDIAESEGMWLHIDGAYGGSALFSARQRHRLAGVHRADSMAWNLHKMLGMTQQCSTLLVRNPAQLADCFATGADYIFQTDKPHATFDAGDATVMCGRRVDVLKLWLAWKSHGDSGFEERIDHAVAMADHARARIRDSDGSLAVIVAGDFTNVCFTWVPPELRPLDLESLGPDHQRRMHALAPAVKATMLAEGSTMLGFQPVHGLNCFRLIVMNPIVGPEDIDAALESVARHSAAEWPSQSD